MPGRQCNSYDERQPYLTVAVCLFLTNIDNKPTLVVTNNKVALKTFKRCSMSTFFSFYYLFCQIFLCLVACLALLDRHNRRGDNLHQSYHTHYPFVLPDGCKYHFVLIKINRYLGAPDWQPLAPVFFSNALPLLQHLLPRLLSRQHLKPSTAILLASCKPLSLLNRKKHGPY